MNMELVIASNNQHKAKEIRSILSGKFDRIYTLADLSIAVDPDESAPDFLGNAMIKARAVAAFTDKAVIADDSGLEVMALGGAPGVKSARYAGEPTSDDRNNEKLLAELNGAVNREARFVTTIVLLFPNGKSVIGQGEVKGEILREKRGTNGFGYDPLFYCVELGKTFGEATDAEKNSVSHRARALKNLLEKL